MLNCLKKLTDEEGNEYVVSPCDEKWLRLSSEDNPMNVRLALIPKPEKSLLEKVTDENGEHPCTYIGSCSAVNALIKVLERDYKLELKK